MNFIDRECLRRCLWLILLMDHGVLSCIYTHRSVRVRMAEVAT